MKTALRTFAANVALVLVDYAPQTIAIASTAGGGPLPRYLPQACWAAPPRALASLGFVGRAAEGVPATRPGWQLIVRTVGAIESWANVPYRELEINPDPNEDIYEGEVTR